MRISYCGPQSHQIAASRQTERHVFAEQTKSAKFHHVFQLEVAASCDLKHSDPEHKEHQLIKLLTLPQCDSQCKR